MNKTRRGPSGCFMAVLGICALALIVLIMYGVAVNNPDLVKQIMGIEPTPAPGYEDGMYMDDMYRYDTGDAGMYYDESGAYDTAMG